MAYGACCEGKAGGEEDQPDDALDEGDGGEAREADERELAGASGLASQTEPAKGCVGHRDALLNRVLVVTGYGTEREEERDRVRFYGRL